MNLNQIKQNSQTLVSSLFIYHICTGTKDTEVNKIDLLFPKELLSLLPWWLRNMSAMQETWFQSLGQEDPPGGGNGNPLQYSCLENSTDGGSWRATIHGVAKSGTRLSN